MSDSRSAPASLDRRASASGYDRIAGLYDLLGAGYSAGAIEASKKKHIARLRPGESVLYAGAGTGVECTLAAQAGAKVTVCDASLRMVDRTRARFAKDNLLGHFEQADALTLDGSFDVVVAPYFLNVFSESEVHHAFGVLAAKINPGGRFVTVDFRGPAGGSLFRALQRLYYLPPQLLFLVLSNNPWHRLYDYPSIAADAAPNLTLSERLITRAAGVPFFETLIWSAPA